MEATTKKLTDALHDTWEARHAGKIAGSDISAILGLNPFKTAYDVWLRIKGKAIETPDNLAMFAGRNAEPLITAIYCEKYGVDPAAVIAAGSKTYVEDGVEIVYTPDRFIVEGAAPAAVLELKNVGRNSARFYGEDGDPNGFPAYHRCQTLVYAALSQLPKAEGVAYFGGADIRRYPLERDAALERDIIAETIAWGKRYVLGDEEPPFEYSEASRTIVLTKFKKQENAITAEPWQAQNMVKISKIDDEIKTLEKEKNQLLYAILNSLPANTKALVSSEGRLTIFDKSGTPKWKEVADSLIQKYNVPDADVARLCNEFIGKSSRQTRLTIKEGK